MSVKDQVFEAIKQFPSPIRYQDLQRLVPATPFMLDYAIVGLQREGRIARFVGRYGIPKNITEFKINMRGSES
jgi:hypothetical protein